MTTEKKKEEKTWQEQLNDTVTRINNREKFEYDLNGDALWNQYKDQYKQMGALAMEDTMGKAQAMTGGYANSYAQQVGQQTYNAYMQELNSKIPDLYNLALGRHQADTDALYNKASFAASMAEKERGAQADNYEKITALIAIGYNPTDEELAGAGMSREQANAIAAAYGMSIDGSDSDGYTPGDYDANPGLTEKEIRSIQEQAKITVDGIWGPNTAAAYAQGIRPKDTESDDYTYGIIVDKLRSYIAGGASKSEISTYLREAHKSGYITDREYTQLKNEYLQSGVTY